MRRQNSARLLRRSRAEEMRRLHISEWKRRLSEGFFDGELSALYSSVPDAARARYLDVLGTFEKTFGDADAVMISAPGRTELAGNHTDHQNGTVLCAAVTLDALAAAAPADSGEVRILSAGFGEIRLTLDDPAPRSEERGTSAGIVRGVAAGLVRRGFKAGGLRAVVSSLVPAGSGLSSSAAFEVLIGAVFSRVYNGGAVDALTLAMIGREAERDYFGKPSGLMDQAASACGGITMIDFADPALPRVERLRFDFREHGYTLCVADTRTSHADLTGDYASIPADMRSVAAYFGQDLLRYVDEAAFRSPENRAALTARSGERAVLRAEHFFEENARVYEMKAALARGDMDAYIAMMNASGASSREKLRNVVPFSHPEQTAMAEALDRAGALLAGRGAWRIHGGGFAGCIQCLVPAADFAAFRSKMDGYYGEGACQELNIRPCGPYALGTEL